MGKTGTSDNNSYTLGWPRDGTWHENKITAAYGICCIWFCLRTEMSASEVSQNTWLIGLEVFLTI